MKHFLLLLFVGFACIAAELSLDGNFVQLDDSGLPVNWVQHRNWEGFKPFATVNIVPGINEGENALHIFNTLSKNGACVRTAKRQKGVSGDTVVVTLKAKGTGQGFVGLYYYTKSGAWNQSSKQQYFAVDKDWKEHTFYFTVGNGSTAETAFFDVTFGGRQGLDTQFTAITVDQEAAKFRGDLTFPKHWNVYAPVIPQFTPTTAELNSLPESLNGSKAKIEQLQANELDFALIMDKQERELCGWAFAELISPIACDYTIGAGADWWLTYYVNGEIVIDTSDTGNRTTPFQINNHLATVHLREGRNFLAVRLLTGAKSSVLMLGGPNDLRNMTRNLKISKVYARDDYDQKNTKRLGNPEIIDGNPAPGLLSITGQGVYKTKEMQTISLDPAQVTMPKQPEIWFTSGIRIQNFGRHSREDSSLAFDFRSQEKSFELKIVHLGESQDLLCEFLNNSKIVKKVTVPYKVLPADFQFSAATTGDVLLEVKSLSDSSSNKFGGTAAFFTKLGQNAFETKLLFRNASKQSAELVLDNYMIGEALLEIHTGSIPYRIDAFKEFNPVKAGWKLAFADEFDGNQVDLSKWEFHRNAENASLDGKGHLLIKTDYAPNSKNLQTSSLWSKPKFGFGYFEARLRFTKQPGWWSAFWLYGDANSNPMLDGFEIDIFEDYYTRPKKAGAPQQKILDHNLHVYTGSLLKSWNYNSRLPGTIDDFYVIGCKWTPFEISYYLNGEQISSTATHSPYNSVTFDAFHHAAGITPLHAIVSGQVMSESWFSKAEEGRFPEYFMVDYVRVYAFPKENEPRITWTVKDPGFFTPVGKVMNFTVQVTPSEKTQAPIKGVYLFDNGYLLDYKTQAPYTFEIPLTPDFYARTNYMQAGRSGKQPSFDGYVHAINVYTQDSSGKVACTEPVLKVVAPDRPSLPYQGKAQLIPGKIQPGFYDEGGQNVAYHDTSEGNYTHKVFRSTEDVDANENTVGHVRSGEWINYTVDIQAAGNYTAELLYGTPFGGEQNVILFLDGKEIGMFRLFQHEAEHWGCDSLAEIQHLKLPDGRHHLTLLMIGGFNMSTLEFKTE
ncbi:MAG: family 16 glycosylhydrolase [Lentisphaeria bacterium]